MSYSLEVEMIRKARQMGLLTTPYVFSAADAIQMAKVKYLCFFKTMKYIK